MDLTSGRGVGKLAEGSLRAWSPLRRPSRHNGGVRHSRSTEFAGALHERPLRGVTRWRDVAADPSAPEALVHRAEVLRAAWRSPIADRLAFLEERCEGKRVLDVGCVAHDAARMRSPDWLHGRLASVAERCVGVDVLDDGVATMREQGFVAVAHDLREGLGPLAAEAPFDVIVAGELIEHVGALDMLFRTASDALVAGGELLVTTPNPYAPKRVRAGQRGIVWENTDHVLYAFPSGMAELAERHGLLLAEAAVTDDRRRRAVKARVRALNRRLRGRSWVRVGYATFGKPRVRRVSHGLLFALWQAWWPGRRFLGETFVYVITRSSVE